MFDNPGMPERNPKPENSSDFAHLFPEVFDEISMRSQRDVITKDELGEYERNATDDKKKSVAILAIEHFAELKELVSDDESVARNLPSTNLEEARRIASSLVQSEQAGISRADLNMLNKFLPENRRDLNYPILKLRESEVQQSFWSFAGHSGLGIGQGFVGAFSGSPGLLASSADNFGKAGDSWKVSLYQPVSSYLHEQFKQRQTMLEKWAFEPL